MRAKSAVLFVVSVALAACGEKAAPSAAPAKTPEPAAPAASPAPNVEPEPGHPEPTAAKPPLPKPMSPQIESERKDAPKPETAKPDTEKPASSARVTKDAAGHDWTDHMGDLAFSLDPKKAMAAAAESKRPLMLFFTSKT